MAVSNATLYEVLKYFAAICLMVATLLMFNTRMASESTLPWIGYLAGNFIWGIDSVGAKNKPWIVMSAIFCLLDLFLIWARLTGHSVQL